MSTWEKKPAIAGGIQGCACCPPVESKFPPNGVIAVGFGYAALHKGREVIWSEDGNTALSDCMTGAEAEKLAAADPDHDWQIVMDGPLRGRTYQRHAPGEWVLIAKNEGFA